MRHSLKERYGRRPRAQSGIPGKHPCHAMTKGHGGENAAGYPPQSFRIGPAPSIAEARETKTDQERGKPDGGARGRGSIPLMSERWGTKKDSEKTRPQNLRTQREEKQKKNDKPHIRQLVGYGLSCGQTAFAFSNELFGGFLMHGEETGRITNHEVRDADVRNGDLLRLNHPRAVQKHQQHARCPRTRKIKKRTYRHT